MDHRTRRALQPSGLPQGQPRVIVATHPGPRILGCGSVVFTVVVGHVDGPSAGGGRCGGAGCTASIAFRAMTILLYSSTGVGCIRSGSNCISGTQSARDEVNGEGSNGFGRVTVARLGSRRRAPTPGWASGGQADQRSRWWADAKNHARA